MGYMYIMSPFLEDLRSWQLVVDWDIIAWMCGIPNTLNSTARQWSAMLVELGPSFVHAVCCMDRWCHGQIVRSFKQIVYNSACIQWFWLVKFCTHPSTYIHTYIHMYTHTYIHTYVHRVHCTCLRKATDEVVYALCLDCLCLLHTSLHIPQSSHS